MVKGRVLVGLVAVMGGLAAPMCRRSVPRLDGERVDNASAVVASGVSDWFWWHGSLPSRYEDVASAFRGEPPEWQPEKDWRISFRRVAGTTEDAAYGGRLHRLEVTVSQPGAGSLSIVEPVDLRDPQRLWKPHYTGLGASLPGGLADTERNVASAIAEAVWQGPWAAARYEP